ncbi:MAG: chemotaxis protein CheC [Gemmatimonadetes bacterium]|jgi:chemotaxis protein CheC|nr:chemotaxis protein CheC [Gemmatimonadota bacterium]MBP6443680.1 chemotaxis protein CheC [Gemmatimonadales bacterium]MBK7595537.1 chemotaxis protein CheC [Gemmatimonadota bacterium]MBK9548944.1 chemotaxis protein CheC [Gemmatimonadota bacterium]MBL0180436.1 chemotaxis protein CheC [Gemmatimonadota bacterium]
MTNPNDLDTLRRDGLREVATIGAGHAATALSQLTDRRIMISVPQVRRVNFGEVPAMVSLFGDHVAVVAMRMLGDLTGRSLLVFGEADATRLCDLILRRPIGPQRALGELEQSGLKEVGNIVCSAYLTALSNFMGMMLLPSVPSLTIGRTADAIAATVDPNESRSDLVFCVDTAFRAEGAEAPLTGAFLLMPDQASIQAILEAIRLD